ncbi:MAG: hypothetical protein WAM69_13430, partial [Candidatus Sulfotelmatobacter sp.]
FYADHDHVVSGVNTAYNQTHGVHWDTDNANITVSKLLATQNLAIGGLVEKSEGPVTITDSHFCSNNLALTVQTPFQGGVVLRNSESVTLTGTTVYNNGVSQVEVIGVNGGIAVTNWETGQQYNLRTEKFTHTGNAIEAVGSSQQVFRDSYLGSTDWTDFQTTLNSNNNVWWNGSEDSAFDIPVSQLHPLSGWRSATGQDGLSSWSQPPNPTAACAVTSGEDYWLIIGSPSQTISAAGSTTFTLSLMPFGGLTGAVALSFDGTSEVKGLSGSLSATSAPLPGAFSLVVKAAAGTPAGTYPITVLANLAGRTRTVTTSVVVP